MSEISDEKLVKEAQLGNNEAMNTIIKRYEKLVNIISSKYYMPGYDKDDINQEGMMGLYLAVLDFKAEKTDFHNFANLCISRKIISLLKSTSRQKNLPLNTAISLDSTLSDENESTLIEFLEDTKRKDPESIIISRENFLNYREKIQSALSTFEFSVWTHYLEGIPYKNIADILSKDTKSIDNAIQRIKKKLSETIKPDM